MQITTEQLVFLKDKIEKMTKPQQLDILRILKKNPAIKLNENKSGIFVNISFLPNESIEEIDKYVKYVGDQESELNLLENQKQEFKNTFFSGMAIGAIEWANIVNFVKKLIWKQVIHLGFKNKQTYNNKQNELMHDIQRPYSNSRNDSNPVSHWRN